MVQAYNFLASWQLFPEKCEFEYQLVPKSGNYKIESIHNGHFLSFSHNWVNIQNEAFYAQYQVNPNGEIFDFENKDLAENITDLFNCALKFTIKFFSVSLISGPVGKVKIWLNYSIGSIGSL